MLLLVSPCAADPEDLEAGRYEHIGRALMPSFRVVVATPTDAIGRPGLSTIGYSSETSLRAAVDKAAFALVPLRLLDRFRSLERTTTRLMVDLSGVPTSSRRAFRACDFLFCGTEEERQRWLEILQASGRITAAARQPDRLRRLIDVVPFHPVNADWEQAVDPLRLFCSSTARRQWGWAEPPRSIGLRALWILRQHGARTLVERSAASLRRRLTSARRSSAPVAKEPDIAGLVAGLASVNDLGAFHRVLSAQGLLAPGSRFVDLEIDVSNKCNIRCRMCYFSFDRVFHAKPAYLTPETFEPIADAILPHARALMLSLGSEPLTSPHFIPILALAARYRVPEVGFYTNGLMMGDRIIDAILEHQVTLVAVSVDAATKQTFESIRRGADFDVLLANVRRLVRRRAEAGRSQPRIRFGVILMRRNIEELPDLVTLAWRLGVEELNFFHAAIYEGLEMEGESLVHHRRLSNECLARAGALADDLGLKIVHHPEPFDLESPDGVARPAAPPPAGPYCRFPFFHVSIDAEGRVLACPFSHGEAPYGVVSRETSFEQIWLGGSFAALRRRILNNDPPPMCRRCTFLASSQPHRAELFAARPH